MAVTAHASVAATIAIDWDATAEFSNGAVVADALSDAASVPLSL